MIDKNIMLGAGAGILALAGLWYAMKTSAAASQQTGTGSLGAGYGMPIYSTIGSAGVSGGNSVTTAAGATIDTSQVGNVADLLASQSKVDQLNAQTMYDVGIINATGNAAVPILARTSDMAGRGSDTILYDSVVTNATGAGGAGGAVAVTSKNQQLVAGGPQNMTLDYSGTTTTVGGNSTAGAPAQQQFTAHLNETVASLKATPVPGASLTPTAAAIPAAPAPVIQQSGGGGGCFITTAICATLGKRDDCTELTVLREFRDTYMTETKERRELVREYYDIAPRIITALSALPPDVSRTIYVGLREVFLIPAIACVLANDNLGAQLAYERMVATARKIARV